MSYVSPIMQARFQSQGTVDRYTKFTQLCRLFWGVCASAVGLLSAYIHRAFQDPTQSQFNRVVSMCPLAEHKAIQHATENQQKRRGGQKTGIARSLPQVDR